ncbi:DUF4194 domain-containing protein [Stenotrophomonas mori]|uniref:DUF4194 domain-containing protein n=1 Tax=Stenotrophomonas mori TaxID=2871096 RepID=A0ABT0SIZ1_9GAMM|nr:DUF4194 domain-containing protein [Stenotrophomonas mori]MCL7715237.1 DUF4194 domain-containing protein [Stenotrophomonas mori]
MKRSWNTLSQMSNGTYAVQDFERAAYRLATEQVLYAADARSRVAYHLVEDHYADFVAALEPLGIRLERNAHYRYVVALPAHGEGTAVTLHETLALLVLRQRYDEAMRQGLIEDHGEVVVELPELQESWQALTGRAMPDVGALRELARTLKRWGVGRLVDSESDDPQPFHLRVRPAIVEIVGEQWLQRLDQHNRDEAGDADTEDDDAAA